MFGLEGGVFGLLLGWTSLLFVKLGFVINEDIPGCVLLPVDGENMCINRGDRVNIGCYLLRLGERSR